MRLLSPRSLVSPDATALCLLFGGKWAIKIFRSLRLTDSTFISRGKPVVLSQGVRGWIAFAIFIRCEHVSAAMKMGPEGFFLGNINTTRKVHTRFISSVLCWIRKVAEGRGVVFCLCGNSKAIVYFWLYLIVFVRKNRFAHRKLRSSLQNKHEYSTCRHLMVATNPWSNFPP